MADISNGPVSSMPGSLHKVPEGQMCDHHEDRPAVRRMQGETDSMGCEYLDLCQECIDRIQAEVEEEQAKPRYCDWCKSEKPNVRPRRDFEEGAAGRLYNVCRDCRDKESASLAEELNEYDEQDRLEELEDRIHW